eukprot:694423-Hanusia_phi.AAC.3
MQRDLLYEILMNVLYLGPITGIHEHLAGDVTILQQVSPTSCCMLLLMLLVQAFHNSMNLENRQIRFLVRSVVLPILKSCHSRHLEKILVKSLRVVCARVSYELSEPHPPSCSRSLPESSQNGKCCSATSVTARGRADIV